MWFYWNDDPDNIGPSRPVDDFVWLIARIAIVSTRMDRTVWALRLGPESAAVTVADITGQNAVTIDEVPYVLTPDVAVEVFAAPTGLDRDPGAWFEPWDDYPVWQFSLPVPSWLHVWHGVLWEEPISYYMRAKPLHAEIMRLGLVDEHHAEFEFITGGDTWVASLLFRHDLTHYGMLIYDLMVNGAPEGDVPGVRLRRL